MSSDGEENRLRWEAEVNPKSPAAHLSTPDLSRQNRFNISYLVTQLKQEKRRNTDRGENLF
jgi:hypothetical protein